MTAATHALVDQTTGGAIEDILPLPPLQQGLLFHALYDPQSLDVYIVQVTLGLEGPLDDAALEAAAHMLLERHAALRAGFRYENLKEPVQIICGHPPLPWRTVDISSLEMTERKVELERLLVDDRACRFNLASPPLVRFMLVRIDGDQSLLVMTYHHMLMDGWSVPIVLRELFQLYASGGDAASLPAATPYRAYHAWLSAQDGNAAREAWRHELAGLGELARLAPPDSGLAPHPTDRVTIQLPEALTRALQQQVRARGLTLNSLIQAAWGTLLGRITGRRDIVFGITVSGRPPDVHGVSGMIGLFINTLPLRLRLNPAAGFTTILSSLQASQARMIPHQHLSLIDIQQIAGVRQLFDTLVVFENYPLNRSAFAFMPPGLRVTSLETRSGTHYPLTLVAVPGPSLQLRLGYRGDLFERATVEAIAGRMVRLLEAFVDDPDLPIGSLDLISQTERRQLIEARNATRKPTPDRCVHELFEEQVAKNPRAIAAVCGDRRLSYVELNLRANQFADRLRVLGVGPEALVGICLERSLEMVIALLAVLKAGGAYVPLDPGWPLQRLLRMIDDAAPRVVIVNDSNTSLSATGIQVLRIDPVRPSGRNGLAGARLNIAHWVSGVVHPGNKKSECLPEQAAYIIYTSGSTGQPKGVVIEHRQIVNYMAAVTERAQLSAGMSFAMVQPLTVDSSATMIYSSLCSGGSLHVIPETLATDPNALGSYFERERIDCLKIAPSHLAALQTGRKPQRLIPRRTLIVGGEASRREWLESVPTMAPGCAVFNHYGPTETTVGVLMHRLEECHESNPSPMVPLGRPIANVQAYVLGREGDPVPVGISGELYIGGAGVGRGYLNRPDLTAERFVPDSFSGQPGARLYRTGDLARFTPEGLLEYLGRLDDQVKLNGYRVELGEIEAALARQQGVRDCHVMARKDDRGALRVVGYIIWETGSKRSIEALHTDLQQHLPPYMIPSAWVELESWPLSAHGKIDRGALPDTEEAQAPDRYVAPRTPTEESLAAIWAEILGRERVSRDDNFFELGGHSLLAIRLVSRTRNTFESEISLRTLFSHPTIAELAHVIDQRSSRKRSNRATGIKRVRRDGHLPVSFNQERRLIMEEAARIQSKIVIPFHSTLGLSLSGPLDVTALESAINEIVRRHEILRTTFALNLAMPPDERRTRVEEFTRTGIFTQPLVHQFVHRHVRIVLCVRDLEDLPLAEREAAIKTIATYEVEQPFDYASLPLLRTLLLRLSSQEHILIITMPHLIGDGWSVQLFRKELAALYDSLLIGAPSPLPEPALQFADFASSQRKNARAHISNGNSEYWIEQWSKFENAQLYFRDLPFAHTQAKDRTFDAAWEKAALEPAVATAIKEFARARNVTLYALVLAAVNIAFRLYTGKNSIAIWGNFANRTQPELETVMGWCTHSHLIGIDMSGDPTAIAVVEQASDALLKANAHQEIPLALLWSLRKRQTRFSDAFILLDIMQDADIACTGGLVMRRFPLARTKMEGALTIAVLDAPDKVGFLAAYAADKFERAGVRRMLEDVQTILDQIHSTPNAPVSTFQVQAQN